jgi:hypothetical protein
VKKIADDEYQISFENELTFQPDSLVNTTRRLLAKDPLTRDYVVNVLNSDNSSVAYGYAISKNEKVDIVACKGRDIVTCKGRVQPKARYVINIKFKPKGMNILASGYLLGGLPFLAFVGFMFLRSTKQRKELPNAEYADKFTLGSALFDAQRKQLVINNEITDLTGTETRLLLIFASSPNEIIERRRLQKEIWVFISKLRKKLELDPNIKIAVIRGKGYKLEISA